MNDQILSQYNQEKLKRVRGKLEQQDDFEKFVRYYDYVKSNIPYRYIKVVLEQEVYRKRVREFDLAEKDFREPTTWDEVSCPFLENIDKACQNGLSFLLYGYNESGKTIEATRLLITAIARGLSGYYLNFKKFLNIYNNAEFQSEADAQALLSYLKFCDLLVLDELGKESNASDNTIGAIEEIIKERNSNEVSTILVTNLPVHKQNSRSTDEQSGFKGRYGNSVYNALLRNFRAFEFSPDGEFRQKSRIDWDEVL